MFKHAIDQENEHPVHDQCCFSLDAVAMYPSLEAKETSEICAAEVVRSGVFFTAINWEELGLYLVLTGQHHGISQECLPTRKFSNGSAPSITTAEALGPIIRKPEDSKFHHPARLPTEDEKKVILFRAVKHGIYTVMKNHTYRWNKSYKLQIDGGPIGDKLACEAARLFMVWFDRNFREHLLAAGVLLRVYKRYVDDGWLKTGCIARGHRWDPNSKRVIQVMPPSEDLTLPDQRTASVCCEIANSVTGMLQWTPDWPSANQGGLLPVLDLTVWCEETAQGTVTMYKFYSKPMTNPVTIPANSALPNGIKFSTYRQEVYRVLRNTSVSLPWSEKAELLSYMSWRMKISGYPTGFRLQALRGGLMGHLKLMNRVSKGLTDLHRSKEAILETKDDKNSTVWFKKSDIPYRSVLFVPSTPGSTLANSIRELEKENRQGRQSRIRVVEQSGTTVRDMLARNYPWDSTACEDPQCFPCTSSSLTGNKFVSCRRPGVGYSITCVLCKEEGIVATYHGESGRNMYTRGKEHLDELRSGKPSNCLVIHNNVHHNGSRNPHFIMTATGRFNKALDRQIDESVRMKFFDRSGVILNSGSEWRADSIPRASFSAPGLETRRHAR